MSVRKQFAPIEPREWPGILTYECDMCSKRFDRHRVADVQDALEDLADEGITPDRTFEAISGFEIHECGPGILGTASLIGGHRDYTSTTRSWVPGWLMTAFLVRLPVFGQVALIQPFRWMLYKEN